MANTTVPQQLARGVTMNQLDEMIQLCDCITALFDAQSAASFENCADATIGHLGDLGLIASSRMKELIDAMRPVRQGGAK